MLAIALLELVTMLSQLTAGAFNHVGVAEVRVTPVVDDADTAIPAAWRELVQSRVADDGVPVIPQRSTAEMDYLVLADVDAVVPIRTSIHTNVVPWPHLAPVPIILALAASWIPN
jgi:hypothetical protein